MKCKFLLIGKNQINRIKSLWNKLNEMHLKDSHYFKDHYKKFTFEERCKKFDEIEDNNIRIELIIDANEVIVGYCISTIDKSMGEIDSLFFIEENYRKYGYGSQLVENSINWLKSRNCNKIMVAVAEGHESVFGFYQKFGFYPRMTYLQMKD
jgi:GNAT superfamily N-acetyltransferase